MKCLENAEFNVWSARVKLSELNLYRAQLRCQRCDVGALFSHLRHWKIAFRRVDEWETSLRLSVSFLPTSPIPYKRVVPYSWIRKRQVFRSGTKSRSKYFVGNSPTKNSSCPPLWETTARLWISEINRTWKSTNVEDVGGEELSKATPKLQRFRHWNHFTNIRVLYVRSLISRHQILEMDSVYRQ